MKQGYIQKAVFSAALAVTMTQAHAAGYMIQETNALFAQAYAGRAAAIEDGSTMFVNPAVLGYQCEHQLILNNSFIIPHLKLHPTSATQTTGAATTNMTSNAGGNGESFTYVPAVYAVLNACDRWKFGLGVTSPFGLQTAYDGGSILRYIATKTKLTTVNINPAVAYRGDGFALGAGISFQRAEADLEKLVNVNVTSLGGTQSDVRSKVTGTNNSMGVNVGAIVEPTCDTLIGLSYRSSIRHKIKGFASFYNLPNFGLLTGSAFSAAFTDRMVSAIVRTPDIVNLSGVYHIDCAWSVLADVMFTRWKVLKKLEVANVASGTPLVTDVQKWRNTLMPSLGVNYRPCAEWLLRAGIAYDQTPTKNRYRDALIPDQSRTWLAGGADYNWCDQLVVKLAYTHIFVKNAKINNTVPVTFVPVPGAGNLPLLPGSNVTGKFKAHIDIIGVQFLVKL